MSQHHRGFVQLPEEVCDLVAFGQNLEGLKADGKVIDRLCTALNGRLQENAVDRQGDEKHGNPVYICQRHSSDMGVVSKVLKQTKVQIYAENGSSLTASRLQRPRNILVVDAADTWRASRDDSLILAAHDVVLDLSESRPIWCR